MINAIRNPTRTLYSKRKYSRLRLSSPIEILWQAREFNCRLRNLNVQGALISGEFPVQISDVIRMIFKPNDIPLEMCLRAKVIHVDGTTVSQFGIIFEDLTTRSRVILADYISRHTPASAR